MSDPKPLLAPLKPSASEPRLWRSGRFVADAWRSLADGEAWPDMGHVVVPLARWRADAARADSDSWRVGVQVAAGETLDPQADAIARLSLIILPFPKFTDGRAYSIARRLREQWDYRGELRASGDVLVDQIALLLHCGFDSLEVRDAATIHALERGLAPVATRHQELAGARLRRWQSRPPQPTLTVAAE